MKKLMTAIAVAGLSAAVFGDVTSANVVGYITTTANTSTKSAQNVMLGCPFANTVADGTKVTDLIVTGYQDVKKHKDNKQFTSLVKIINEKGNAVQEFQWYDTYNGSVWAGGYWRDRMNGDKRVVDEVKDPETEILSYVIPTGTGLWCNIGYGSSTSHIVVTCAGQVLTAAQEFTANTSTKSAQNVAACNPLAREVDLTEVSITGYQDVKKHKDNKQFTSLIKIINEKGNAVKEYQWYDTYNGSNWAGGYWRDRMDGDKKVVKVISDPTNETTASLPAGQGLWCNIGYGSSTSHIKIIWPKTDLN